LFLTTLNGVPQCIFMEKRIRPGQLYPRMTMPRLFFDAGLFNGTVFEGELVYGTHHVFLVTDLLVDRAASTGNLNFPKRLNRIYNLLGEHFIRDGLDPAEIQVKRFFKYEEFDEIEPFAATLPYASTALVFTPLFVKFREIWVDLRPPEDRCVKRTILKLKMQPKTRVFQKPKQADKISEDQSLKMSEDQPRKMSEDQSRKISEDQSRKISEMGLRRTSLPDVYEIVELKDIACIPTLAVSKEMRRIFDIAQVNDTIRMKCAFHDKFKKWVPLVGGCPC
jgi:hypothetical protein